MHLILFGSGNALQMNVGKYWNWSLFYIYWSCIRDALWQFIGDSLAVHNSFIVHFLRVSCGFDGVGVSCRFASCFLGVSYSFARAFTWASLEVMCESDRSLLDSDWGKSLRIAFIHLIFWKDNETVHYKYVILYLLQGNLWNET